MNKTELESKHISELHTLAAEAGVEGYRMLRRDELIEKLAGGKPAKGGGGREPRAGRESTPQRERPPRRRRERPPRKPAEAKPSGGPRRSAEPKREAEPADKPAKPKGAPAPEPAAATGSEPERPRRRRRFGRRKKAIGASDLLLPPPGRQALVYGETRAACSALLLEVAAELAGSSKGAEPIALLVDPSPEELAGWRREVPQAEIVAAGKARHASDAVAQAVRRAEGGEDVILLVDSLSRLEDAGVAQEIFDCGVGLSATGSLTVVAALERQQ
jgi:transcription termination factor Rho